MKSNSRDHRYYLASLLLRSDAYETELNEQLLGELRTNPAAPEILSPQILPGPPNRIYFIDRLLSELAHLPFDVEILTPEEEVEQQLDNYDEGRPDPVNPDRVWRVLQLDARLVLGGVRVAKIIIRELPAEDLVLISFAFDPTTIRADDLPHFRAFLLALTKAFPVMVATLGLDLDAATAGMPDDQPWREHHMSFNQLANAHRKPSGSERSFDFVLISRAVAGGSKSFIYDGITPQQSVTKDQSESEFHDLRQFGELAESLARSDQAYDRMYESSYPKDDWNDALLYLNLALKLAESLGLEDLESRIKERHAHINGVYNSQFRRW